MLTCNEKIQSKSALMVGSYRLSTLVTMCMCLLGYSLVCAYAASGTGRLGAFIAVVLLSLCAMYLTAILTLYSPCLYHYRVRWQRTALYACTMLVSISFIVILSTIGALLSGYSTWMHAAGMVLCGSAGALMVFIADKAMKRSKEAIAFADALNKAIADKEDISGELCKAVHHRRKCYKLHRMYVSVGYDLIEKRFAPQLRLSLRPDEDSGIF